jgi:hypothetical protein
MSTVSVHQPNFMPWLKLLDKILASDIYVAYDTVQYTKSEFHSRQKVMSNNGPVWLSVPLVHLRGTRQLIKDIRIENRQPFRYRHLKTLRKNYGSSPYFGEVYSLIDDVYEREHERLVDLNVDLIHAICSYLEADVRIVRASTVPHDGDKTDRIVEMVRNVGGSEHLTSTFGGDHQEGLDWRRFQEVGIPVRSQCFDHPEYEQPGHGFTTGLAAVDMLFACGRRTGEILAERRSFVPITYEPAPLR